MENRRFGGIVKGGVLGVVVFSVISYAVENSSLNITAQVPNYCVMISASDITVVYNPFSSSTTSNSGNFNFQCTRGTTFYISADSNNNPEGTYGRLKHEDPTISDYIEYSLAANVSYGSIYKYENNIFQNPLTLTAPTVNPPSAAFNIVLITPSQDIHIGNYSDTVTLTISW